MAVKVEGRSGWLGYRLCVDGWKGRESTGCRDTPGNRARLERKAAAMSDEMADGRFDYLRWFPDGNRAAQGAAGTGPVQRGGARPTAQVLLGEGSALLPVRLHDVLHRDPHRRGGWPPLGRRRPTAWKARGAGVSDTR